MRAVLFVLLLSCLGGVAAAGPWLREDGAVFLSFGQTVTRPDGAPDDLRTDHQLYAEWGWTEGTTLALSAHTGDSGRERRLQIKAITAAPWPPDRPDRLTLSYGIGARRIAGTPGAEPLLHAGLAWGRGLDSGWLSAEAQVTIRPRGGGTEGKLDLTLGHDLSPRWTGSLLVSAGTGRNGTTYANLTPGLTLRTGETTRLSLGLTRDLFGGAETGLSLQTWLEF